MDFLTALKSLVDTLGATVLLPVFIFIFALILGAKAGKAFRAAVTIGVAFIGINLVVGLMWGSLSGVSQALVTNAGIERDIVDVGWPAAAAVAFATDVGLWVIPVALIVNFVLLFFGVTRTLNVDIWNFWHYAFLGSLVAAVSGSLPMGLVAAGVGAAFMLFLGDWTAKGIQEFYDLPGISIPHGMTAPVVPLALPFSWLYDRIPGLNKIDADPQAIEDKLGPTLGDPMVMGLLIGVVLGLIAYFGEFATDWIGTIGKIILLGVNLAAVMVLLPRMVRILMEGLIPVSEAARDFMSKRASSNDEIYIGLDSAVLIGHPSAISTGLLLVPIAIILSIILPGNRMLLFADLAVLPFLCSQIAPMAKGNIVKMVTIGTFLLAIGFYIANALAPVITTVAGNAGFAIPENAVYISSIADGFIWTPLAFMWAGSLGNVFGWVAIGLFAVIVGLLFFFYNKNRASWDKLVGASAE
ncbi:MAG: PTS galactitol transporter subunit IIC [Anaerolineaceae bacterium]|nr:PTS galactitol transporter subunit IIC [Anaerolineaceae bacterium]